MAARSHSIRHIWMACQSRAVWAVKNTLTAKAPTRQDTPAKREMAAGTVSPRSAPSETSSDQPGISRVRGALRPTRLVPQE